jgi:hypothetical protein
MGAKTEQASPLVGEACRFFDHMADLIDPRFYYDDGRDPINLRYMKKAARNDAKAALKEKGKQQKRTKLNPEAALTTVELQKKQQAAKQQQQQEAAAAAAAGGKGGGKGSAAAGGAQPPAAAAGHQRGGAAELGPGSARQQQQNGLQFKISSGRCTLAQCREAFRALCVHGARPINCPPVTH